MRLQEAITLIESRKEKLLLLDVDDTIVKAKNIYIYKKVGGQEIKLTPNDFAKEKVTPETEHMYDYRDFRNAEKISGSIKSGEPIVKVLKYMDNMIKKGYKIGILTARGMEDVIRNTLQSWLMYEKAGKLKNIGSKLKEVFAISDELKGYKGETTFEKKANVIRDLAKRYSSIVFIDDDIKNVNAVNSLNLHNVKSKSVDEVDG